jgi:hypothetical protein
MTWINCTGFLEIGRRVIRIRYMTYLFRRFVRIILSVVFYMFRVGTVHFHIVSKKAPELFHYPDQNFSTTRLQGARKIVTGTY